MRLKQTLLATLFLAATSASAQSATPHPVPGRWEGTIDCDGKMRPITLDVYKHGYLMVTALVTDGITQAQAKWYRGKTEPAKFLPPNGTSITVVVDGDALSGVIEGADPAKACKWKATRPKVPVAPKGAGTRNDPLVESEFSAFYFYDYEAADTLFLHKQVHIRGRVVNISEFGSIKTVTLSAGGPYFGPLTNCFVEKADHRNLAGLKEEDTVLVYGKVRGGGSKGLDFCKVLEKR